MCIVAIADLPTGGIGLGAGATGRVVAAASGMRETDATEGGGLGGAKAATLCVVAIHGVAGGVVHAGQTSNAIDTLVVEPGGGGRCGDAGHDRVCRFLMESSCTISGCGKTVGLWILSFCFDDALFHNFFFIRRIKKSG